MAEKVCAQCGQLNRSHANYCSACGAHGFADVTLEQGEAGPPYLPLTPESYALRLSIARIIILSIVTSGMYVLYWLYLTWKHLQSETGDVHYPVWHALTFLVPVYGLFRIYKHVAVIQAVSQRAGVEALLSPVLAVTMVALYWPLGMLSANSESIGTSVVLGLIGLALITTVVVRAQTTLNNYWSSVKGEALASVPFGAVEVVFVILVLVMQVPLTIFLGSGAPTTP